MPRLRVGLSHAKPQGKPAVELRVRQEQISTLIQPVHDRLIGRVPTLVPKTNQVQGHRRRQFKPGVLSYPICELLREPHMLANMMLQALDSTMPDYKPQLQRPKAAPQLNMPVAIVNDGSGFRRLIPQIFGQNAESLNQGLPVRHPEAAAIEIGKHPLMRIEIVAVRRVHPVLKVPKLRTEHRR